MALVNVKNALYFKVKAGGSVMSLGEVRTSLNRPKLPLAGVNFYYGVNDQNVHDFTQSGKALNSTHNNFFKSVVTDLQNDPGGSWTVVLAVQPPKFKNGSHLESYRHDPFAFVMQQKALLTKLAAEILEYKTKASPKTLRVIIRYASEMNDVRSNAQGTGGNAWGQQPVLFKSSFAFVRNTMRSVDPDLLFAFSPAIRYDLHPSQKPDIFQISKYYPGDDLVDVVSGTWYVGRPQQLDLTAKYFAAHVLQHTSENVIYGLDEVGGFNTADENKPKGACDPTLISMMKKLEPLAAQGVNFDYSTFFMQKGNRDWHKAKLTFV